jgi:hypothetical protein
MEHAFSLTTSKKIRYPYVKCQNARCFDNVILTKHLVQNDVASNYKTWVFHGEKYTIVIAEESKNDRRSVDRMDEMLFSTKPLFIK